MTTFPVVGKDWPTIVKAFDGPNNTTIVEGWLSTPDEDAQKDIVEPEAFMKSIDSFFARRAPLSLNHDLKALPVGHLQKGAIVRDGKILKSASHPTDPADFEHFPNNGSGVYVRAAITNQDAASAVRLGNVGGFSWVGKGKGTPRGPKGTHYTEIDLWMESTLAAYPINHTSIITVAKAFGYEQATEEETPEMNEEAVALLKQLVALQSPAQGGEQAVTKSEVTMEKLEQLLTSHKEALLTEVDNRVKKAVDLVREEGAGSKATIIKSVLPDENPLAALVRKAEKGEELNYAEKELISAATKDILTKGMNGSSVAEIRYL